MTTSDLWDEQTAARYDSDAADMYAPDVLEPTVEFLSGVSRLGGGAGIRDWYWSRRNSAARAWGTGDRNRIVRTDDRPATAQDRPVDAAGSAIWPRHARVADDALVYLVWNSISNVRTQQGQVACFRNAARHLSPGGRFVIELWIPPIRRPAPGQHAAPMHVDERHLVLDTYDLVTQQCISHHYRQESDGTIRYEQGHFRYIWPAECDLMAQLAGMELEQRVADWAAARSSPPTQPATYPCG